MSENKVDRFLETAKGAGVRIEHLDAAEIARIRQWIEENATNHSERGAVFDFCLPSDRQDEVRRYFMTRYNL